MKSKRYFEEYNLNLKFGGAGNVRKQVVFVEDSCGVVVELTFLIDAVRSIEGANPPATWKHNCKTCDEPVNRE